MVIVIGTTITEDMFVTGSPSLLMLMINVEKVDENSLFKICKNLRFIFDISKCIPIQRQI